MMSSLCNEVSQMAKHTYLPTATIHAPARRRAALRRALDGGATVRLCGVDGATIESPELVELLNAALAGLANGSQVVVLASDAELSPTETGQLLGLSRQYVDRLIDLGDLPARQLPGSSHRRVRTEDIVAFQQRRTLRRSQITNTINDLIDAGADY